MTPTGVITECPLLGGRQSIGITSGPDGNLWFTEYGADRIGRLNPNAGSQAAIQASIVAFIVRGEAEPLLPAPRTATGAT